MPHPFALAAAYALAVPIGWNRERAERSAGLRTFPLVAVAACAFVQATGVLLAEHPEGAARIVQGVITGIGFIGGALVKHGTSVLGTATAASLWATGAMGVAVGLGAYDLAVAVSALIFVTLRFVSPDKAEDGRRRNLNAGWAVDEELGRGRGGDGVRPVGHAPRELARGVVVVDAMHDQLAVGRGVAHAQRHPSPTWVSRSPR